MRSVSLDEVLSNAFQYEMDNIYTALPCIVLTVYGEGKEQRVDVQSSINSLDKDGTEREAPPLMGVPVIFPASKTSMLSFPINKGDTVLCVFSQRGTDNFKIGSGSPTKPTDYRTFDKRDAIAIPGLFPFSKALNNPTKRQLSHSTLDAVLSHNIGTGKECEVRLKASGDIELNTPSNNVTVNCKAATVNATDVAINATSMVVDVANSTWTGNLTMNGTYTLDGIVINTHKHSGVTPGSGTTSTPTN